MTIPVLYQDAHILVCNKPSGLLSTPGRDPEQPDVTSVLRAQYGELGVVHRLDWETSGLLVLSRNPQAHRELNRQFHDREVDKRYVAVCFGEPAARGQVDFPLGPDYLNRPRQQIDWFFGKDALTRWEVLSVDGEQTRVQLYPVTGRSHQLRVHMAALGHPLLGDELYAPEEVVAMSPRLCLHAEFLSFKHPASTEPLSLQVDADF